MLLPVQEDKNSPLSEFVLFPRSPRIDLPEKIASSKPTAYPVHSVALQEMPDGGETWHAPGFHRSTHHMRGADTKVPTETWGS